MTWAAGLAEARRFGARRFGNTQQEPDVFRSVPINQKSGFRLIEQWYIFRSQSSKNKTEYDLDLINSYDLKNKTN
jgi:hypothetical protein